MTNFNRIKSGVMPIVIASTAALLLAACSSDEDPVDPSISGVVVVPVQTTKLSPRRASTTGADACKNIPNGYAALANASIAYIDASGSEATTTLSTDACGAFHVNPGGAAKLSFQAPGYRAVTTDVNVFRTANSKYQVVSTIPTTSSYVISGLSLNVDGSVSFVVEDNVTNKAVIGIPESAFSITENGITKQFSSIKYRSASSANKDTVLTIDASGSMGATVHDGNGNSIIDQYGKTVDRRDLTALASYDFISSLANNDRLAITIFSSSVYFFDDDYLDTHATMYNQNGNPVDLGYSKNGFEKDRLKSEFVIDIYNTNSSLHGGSGKQAAFDFTGSFPYLSGSTAVYDALYTSVEKLEALKSPNSQFVILMTDGGDNSSSHTYQQAISYARQNNVITNTIGFIGGNNVILQEIATQTGGTFYEATGLNIADAFSAAQSAIDYAYTGIYNSATRTGDFVDLNLTLTHTGLTVSQTLATTK